MFAQCCFTIILLSFYACLSHFWVNRVDEISESSFSRRTARNSADIPWQRVERVGWGRVVRWNLTALRKFDVIPAVDNRVCDTQRDYHPRPAARQPEARGPAKPRWHPDKFNPTVARGHRRMPTRNEIIRFVGGISRPSGQCEVMTRPRSIRLRPCLTRLDQRLASSSIFQAIVSSASRPWRYERLWFDLSHKD